MCREYRGRHPKSNRSRYLRYDYLRSSLRFFDCSYQSVARPAMGLSHCAWLCSTDNDNPLLLSNAIRKTYC